MITKFQKTSEDLSKMRSFGITIGSAFTILSIFLFLKNNQFYLLTCLLAVMLFSFGLLSSKALIPIYKLWMELSKIMGTIMTTIILTLLFFIILTPISLFAKSLNKIFLDEKISKKQKSYWVYIEQSKTKHYDKQF